MRSFPFLQTSVFVDDRYRFTGNQLATFWDSERNAGLTREEMQGIALEMGFSETTFITQTGNPECSACLRIFTPGDEIPFAGHPTLGTAFVMKKKELIQKDMDEILLELGVGPTRVNFVVDDMIQMSQSQPMFLTELEQVELLCSALSIERDDIKGGLPLQFVTTGLPYLIVPLKTLSAVQNANPNPALITDLMKDQEGKQILIFSTEVMHDDSDVHARMFAPELGVIEDPATGSAAGPLAAYCERYDVLDNHIHGSEIRIEQGYEIKRPSLLVAEVVGKEVIDQVLVSGRVKLVAESTFFLND